MWKSWMQWVGKDENTYEFTEIKSSLFENDDNIIDFSVGCFQNLILTKRKIYIGLESIFFWYSQQLSHNKNMIKTATKNQNCKNANENSRNYTAKSPKNNHNTTRMNDNIYTSLGLNIDNENERVNINYSVTSNTDFIQPNQRKIKIQIATRNN
ncbi:hypothetical protein M0811_08125 [Anaeramoeba ignava]|uniref:Uncharacterized protein n=1 Tax=Anaeramoeba ignava TaxID=1746090 RepID=A0A9Q0LLL9_ANAIG|nr:hypothetical protein M0811_08125 [Anaeramoeba ignava]